MKKLLLITIIALLFSCEPEEMQSESIKTKTDCPEISAIGNDKFGDFIILIDYSNTYTHPIRYKVDNYNDYKLGQIMCDTKGLIKQPN